MSANRPPCTWPLAPVEVWPHSLLYTTYPSVISDLVLTLTPNSEPVGNSNSSGASMSVCPVIDSWQLPIDETHPPAYDCSALAVPASLTAANKWEVDLAPLIGYWRIHSDYGFALVAASTASGAWQVSFDPGADALRVPAAGASETERHPTLTPTGGSPGVAADQKATRGHAVGAIGSGGFPRAGAVDSQCPLDAHHPSVRGVAGGPRSGLWQPGSGGQRPTKPDAVVADSGAVPAGSTNRMTQSGGVSTWVWVVFGVLLLVALGLRMPRIHLAWQEITGGFQASRQSLSSRSDVHLPKGVIAAAGAVGGVVCVAWLALRLCLPRGLPTGVLLLGVILGSLTGLTAIGLVLTYRVVRAINLAQAEIGGLAAATALILITGEHVPYLLAIPCGLVAAVITGLLMELIMHRFRNAPRPDRHRGDCGSGSRSSPAWRPDYPTWFRTSVRQASSRRRSTCASRCHR